MNELLELFGLLIRDVNGITLLTCGTYDECFEWGVVMGVEFIVIPLTGE